MSAPSSDLREVDEVWVVVDKDGKNLDQFIELCRRHKYRGIVSNPCFEVWLAAHYTRVKAYRDQADAQRHYLHLSGQRYEDR